MPDRSIIACSAPLFGPRITKGTIPCETFWEVSCPSYAFHRNEAINLVIRRRFSGELLRADGEPKSTLREEGVYSVNKRNELLWTLTLKPGEERKLTYRYTVLVVSG